MSSIGTKIASFFGFDKYIVVSVGDLKNALAGSASDEVKAAIEYAGSKVNRNVGSIILRHYLKAYSGTQHYAFASHEWKTLAHEFNYLTGDRRNRTASNTTTNGAAPKKVEAPVEGFSVQSLFTSNALEQSPSVWFSTVFKAVQSRGNAFVKAAIKSEEDVKKILTLEGGLVGGKMVLNARANGTGSFFGPFQVGALAWADGPEMFSKYKLYTGKSASELAVTTSKLAELNRTFAAGGPGDLRVMAPGIVAFWNSSWNGFVAQAKKDGQSSKLAKVPRTAEMLYLLHNQGGGGATKLLAAGVTNPIDAGQSTHAQAVGLTVKKQYLA